MTDEAFGTRLRPRDLGGCGLLPRTPVSANPFGIILWRLARRRQVDGTLCALSRSPVRPESNAGLLASCVELVGGGRKKEKRTRRDPQNEKTRNGMRKEENKKSGGSDLKEKHPHGSAAEPGEVRPRKPKIIAKLEDPNQEKSPSLDEPG